MKVLIIEDELPAREKLKSMLVAIDSSIDVVATTGSVKDTVEWLDNHENPDLAFVDIQLSDSHSFDIFKQRQIKFPVVFTTAYDKYVLASFDYNSIDYLLKPITDKKLRKTLAKIKVLENNFSNNNIAKAWSQINQTVYQRILCKKVNDFIPLEINNIAYFFTEHRIVFAIDKQGQRLMVDKTLTALSDQMPADIFFRINRKYLCSYQAIEKFKSEKGKIRVVLNPNSREAVYVSKENAPLFRKWVSSE